MLSGGEWLLGQQNAIKFVLIDNAGAEVSGLGGTFTLQLSKGTAGALQASAGTKGEIGSGMYYYVSTAGEADTRGPVGIVITDALIQQQNLEYVVGGRNVLAIEFTYIVTNFITGLQEEGVQCWFKRVNDAAADAVWYGVTDAFGVARDSNGNLPFLDSGTYY